MIQTSQDVEEFRRRLFSALEINQQKRIIIHYGNRNSKSDIEQLHLEKAKELYIIGEESRTDDMESYHDTMNMKCLDLVYEEVEKISHFKKIEKENGKESIDNRLLCRFMFEYQTTFNVFQYSPISENIKKRINFKPFHYYEMWAQKVLVSKTLDKTSDYEYLPLEGEEGIKKDDSDYVHLVVVGMTRMGTALATQAALMAHYPNFVTKGIRTKITLIDENADKEKNFFIDRYDRLFALSNWSYKEMVRSESGADKLETVFTHTPIEHDYLGGDFLDVEWEFIQGTVAQLKLQQYIEDCASKTKKMTIAICKDEPSRCLAAALNLDWRIYDKALQVLVYNRYDDALIKQIKPTVKTNFVTPFGNKLKAFGMATECYCEELLSDVDFIAQEFNKVYGKVSAVITASKSKQITFQSKGKSPVAKNWSNIYNANTLWTKLRCVKIEKETIDAEDIDILAKVEHNRWVIEQLIMSYRHLSPEEQEQASKDANEKEWLKGEMAHLNICSNEKLEEIDIESRQYDLAFAEELLRIKTDLDRYKNDGSRDNSTAC